MANDYTPVTQFVSKATGEFLETKNPILATSTGRMANEFKNNMGYAPGDTVDVKIPVYPTVQRGSATTAQDIESRSIAYTISDNDIYSVVRNVKLYDEIFNIAGGEKALSGNQKAAINANYVVPGYVSMAAEIEQEFAGKLNTTAHLTPDDDPENLSRLDSFSGVSICDRFMDDMKFQRSERYGMINSVDANNLANSLQNSFQPALNQKITKTALVASGRLANFDMYKSSDLRVHTAGPQYAVAPNFTLGAAVAEGTTTLTLTGVQSTAGKLFNAGDKLAIQSVKVLDQSTKRATEYGLVVTIVADTNGNNDGTVTVTISEELWATGEKANISALPANGAAVKMYNDHRESYFYVPSGLIATPIPLGDIYGAKNSVTSVSDGKVPVKCILQGDAGDLTNMFRTSFLLGTKVLAPYVVVRITKV